jgi:glyoxylate reductase
MKPSIFVTRELPPKAMQRLASYFEVSCNPDDLVLSKRELLKHNTKDALLCLLTDPIDREVIEANPTVKVISNYAVGYNNIDVDTATQLGIPVCTTPGVLTEASADLTWALLMAIGRRIIEADRYVRQGKWQGWGPMLFLGGDVFGKTLGVVGMGRIGQAVARRAKGFGMRVLYTSPSPKHEIEQELGAQKVELDFLLAESDFVSLHCPLGPETTHLIASRELALMKPDSYLINTSRGLVVDEAALLDALRSKEIAGAALDVFEKEPEILPGLCDLGNVVVAPHIASATIETRTKMGLLAAENAIAIFEGKRPYSIVNEQVLSQQV